MTAPRLCCLTVCALLLGLAACADGPRSAARVEPAPTVSKPEKEKPDKDKPEKDKGGKEKLVERNDVSDLHMEVTALQVLYYLQATSRQREALAGLAKTTAPKPGPRKAVAISDKHLKALRSLRDALAEANDEKVDLHEAEVEELRAREAPEYEDIEITDEARKEAGGFVKTLSARQVVGYLAGLASDFPDPGELLTEALAQSRLLKAREWRDYRDDVAYQLGWLVAGVASEPAEEKVRDQVTALLNKAAGLSDKEFEAQRKDLEKAAKDIADKVGPADVIRHYMERVAAELLSNPRLPAALELRQKAKKE